MRSISVIDNLSPIHLPRLIPHLDQLGYHRFWATEHHTPTQSASPILVTCLAAAMTARIRVGTAGVLLNYTSPAKITEDFKLLELYFSGRIDLGISSSHTQNDVFYLDGRKTPDHENYAERARILMRLVRDQHEILVGPLSPTMPTVWLCGSSVRSGALAGELGVFFACHSRGSSPERVRSAIDAYRDSYRGSESPYASVCAYGSCASNAHEAQRLWSTSAGLPDFVGDANSCVEQLDSIVAHAGADEAVVQLHILAIDARLAGYHLLAEAAGLRIDTDQYDAHDSRETALQISLAKRDPQYNG